MALVAGSGSPRMIHAGRTESRKSLVTTIALVARRNVVSRLADTRCRSVMAA